MPAKFTFIDPPSKYAGDVAAQSRQTRGPYFRRTSQLMLCGYWELTNTLRAQNIEFLSDLAVHRLPHRFTRATYMTFEDYRNNKTKNGTSEDKTLKLISV